MLGRRVMSQEILMLGERIRSRRISLSMSQEALAEKAGISTNTVSRIEGGQMAMSVAIFIKLVQALDADANDLLGFIPRSKKGQYRDICYHINHLKAAQQEIVFHTMEALVEGLRRDR